MGFFNRVFSGGPKDPPALRQQVEKAMSGLKCAMTAHDQTWHIGDAAWSLDQDVGNLIFSLPQGTEAIAPAQIIGTYNISDGTWLWGWQNPSIDPSLLRDAKKLYAYGKQHDYEKLTERKLKCSENEAWELTALAYMICGANGAYRGPAGTALVFMTFGEVKLSKAR
jgi:hypothetical protein